MMSGAGLVGGFSITSLTGPEFQETILKSFVWVQRLSMGKLYLWGNGWYQANMVPEEKVWGEVVKLENEIAFSEV